jgi:hypothetical protein
MATGNTTIATGGCQCGAIRYALSAEPTISVCFCRMCQKAVGGYFGAFATVSDSALTWTKGSPASFASSDAAERGFCPACVTPLTFKYHGKGRISVTAGSLDEPARTAPSEANGVEGRPPFIAEIAHLPGSRTGDGIPAAELARYASRQHPDHD